MYYLRKYTLFELLRVIFKNHHWSTIIIAIQTDGIANYWPNHNRYHNRGCNKTKKSESPRVRTPLHKTVRFPSLPVSKGCTTQLWTCSRARTWPLSSALMSAAAAKLFVGQARSLVLRATERALRCVGDFTQESCTNVERTLCVTTLER